MNEAVFDVERAVRVDKRVARPTTAVGGRVDILTGAECTLIRGQRLAQ